MIVVRVVVFLAGTGVAAGTLMSAIRTVILPRSAQSILTRAVFRSVRVPFRLLAHERRTFAARDAVMALFGPVGLVSLIAAWLALVILSFTAIFWALDTSELGAAFLLSGSSVTTLGFADPNGLAEQVLTFTESGLGLFLVALMITYLPSMYGAFSRREREVALLEVRAGSPPSAVEMIIRYHRLGSLEELAEAWERWEAWFAELEESHTSYATLTFFRSPQADRSWVTAAGTILDAAALMSSTVAGVPTAPAGICIRSGYIALRRISDFFAIAYDPDPAPGDPISIARSEFDQAYDEMESAGVPVVPDRDRAWRDFAGWRVNYDTVVLALAEITMAPYAPWTSDRSAPDHVRRRVRRFGKKRAGPIGP